MRQQRNEDDIQLHDVTYHAVTRYVQRVVGHELDESGSPLECAERHAAAIGMSIDDIRRIVLCPEVRAAISLGVSRAKTAHFAVRITKDGVVVTVLPLQEKPCRRKLKIPSRNESRKQILAYQRKKKRSPKRKGRA